MSDLSGRDACSSQNAELARVHELLTEALSQPAFVSRRSAAASASTASSLVEACRIARARGLQPEHLIVMLKAAWERVRDARYATRGIAQEALDHAVSACIREYFTEPTDGAECQKLSRQ